MCVWGGGGGGGYFKKKIYQICSNFLTLRVDVEVEHGGVGVLGRVGQVEAHVVMVTEELLELDPVLDLEEGAHRPHQGEDVQVLVVHLGKDGGVLLVT